MLLREFKNGYKKLDCNEAEEITHTLEEANVFLHPLFKRHGMHALFCSNSNRFFIMDNEAFKNIGKLYLAKNRNKKIEINKKLEFFAPIITSRCNMNCKYCLGYGGLKKGQNGNFEIIKKAIDFISTQECRPVIEFIAVGEALLNYPLLRKVLEYMKEKNIKPKMIKMSSNGTGNIKHYLELVEMLDLLQISFDGLPEIQDLQRPMKNNMPSSLIVSNTIKELADNNKKFVVKITVTKKHCGKEESTVRYLKNLGVKNVALSVVGSLGAGKNFAESYIAKENLKAVRAELKIKELCDIVRISCKVMVGSYLGSDKAHYCHLGNNFVVGVDGTITPCGVISEREDLNLHKAGDELVIGHINAKKGVQIFWEKVEKLRKYPFMVKKCSNCDFKLCWGGCPLRNLSENGSLEKPSKELCVTRKQETIEYMKYLVWKEYLKLVPRLEKNNGTLYLKGLFIKLPLKESLSKSGCNFIVKFDPRKDDLLQLFDTIRQISERNKKRFCLFILSPPCNVHLNVRESIALKEFLFNLEKARIMFKIAKPIKISDANSEKEQEFYKYFEIPKNCFECLELFRAEKGKTIMCDGKEGPSVDSLWSREELYKLLHT